MKNALALGTFDGLHIGHMAVLNIPTNYRKTVLTFEQAPKASISGKGESIMTCEQKIKALEALGIDQIDVMRFEDVRDIVAEDFLFQIKEKYSPNLISCGFNYRFGKNGEGDIATLERFCSAEGIILKCAEPVCKDGNIVSSTFIRQLLKDGLVEKASALLNEPFSFTAEVIKGEQRGRTIGFPTINQQYPDGLVKLRFGTYKTKVEFDGNTYFGITNIGIRPTFVTQKPVSETYIKDFSGVLYGKRIKITPLLFLRDEVKFDSLEALKNQIAEDLLK